MRARILTTLGAVAACGVLAGCGGSATEDDSPRLKAPGAARDGLLDPKPRDRGAGSQRSRARAAPAPPSGGSEPAAERAPERTATAERGVTLAEIPPDVQSEIEAVKATVRDFVSRANARDVSLCSDLFTQRHLEEGSEKRGSGALADCRRDIAASDLTLRLVRIHRVQIAGGRAVILVTMAAGGNEGQTAYRMTRRAGRWLFDGNGSAELR